MTTSDTVLHVRVRKAEEFIVAGEVELMKRFLSCLEHERHHRRLAVQTGPTKQCWKERVRKRLVGYSRFMLQLKN